MYPSLIKKLIKQLLDFNPDSRPLLFEVIALIEQFYPDIKVQVDASPSPSKIKISYQNWDEEQKI